MLKRRSLPVLALPQAGAARREGNRGLYDRYLLPPLLNAAMGAKPIAYQRRKVVPQASGDVFLCHTGGQRKARVVEDNLIAFSVRDRR